MHALNYLFGDKRGNWNVLSFFLLILLAFFSLIYLIPLASFFLKEKGEKKSTFNMLLTIELEFGC